MIETMTLIAHVPLCIRNRVCCAYHATPRKDNEPSPARQAQYELSMS